MKARPLGRSSLLGCSDPLPHGDVTHAERLSDDAHWDASGVGLQGEANPLLLRLPKYPLRAPHLLKEYIGSNLVGDGSRGRSAARLWGRCGHGCSPTIRSSVGTAVARHGRAWKDPTRIPLGSDLRFRVEAGTTRDLDVAFSEVNGDLFESCLPAIVAADPFCLSSPPWTCAGSPIVPRLRAESTDQQVWE